MDEMYEINMETGELSPYVGASAEGYISPEGQELIEVDWLLHMAPTTEAPPVVESEKQPIFYRGKKGFGERVREWMDDYKQNAAEQQERYARYRELMAEGKKDEALDVLVKPYSESLGIEKVMNWARSETEWPAGFADLMLRVVPTSAGKFVIGVMDFMFNHLPRSFIEPVMHTFMENYSDTKLTDEMRQELIDQPAEVSGLEELDKDLHAELGKAIAKNAEGLARFHGEQLGFFGTEDFLRRWATDPVGATMGILIPWMLVYRQAGIAELDSAVPDISKLPEFQPGKGMEEGLIMKENYNSNDNNISITFNRIFFNNY